MKSVLCIAALLCSLAVSAHSSHANQGNQSQSHEKIFFVEPADGAVVTSPLKVKFGMKGMKLCQANVASKNKKCGHHHLLIDKSFIPEGQPVPADENHIHYGKMQQEAELTLAPGKHSLTLQFADYAHLSFGEKLSATINVEVKEAGAAAPAPGAQPASGK